MPCNWRCGQSKGLRQTHQKVEGQRHMEGHQTCPQQSYRRPTDYHHNTEQYGHTRKRGQTPKLRPKFLHQIRSVGQNYLPNYTSLLNGRGFPHRTKHSTIQYSRLPWHIKILQCSSQSTTNRKGQRKYWLCQAPSNYSKCWLAQVFSNKPTEPKK